MLLCGGSQHNIVKQLSSNQKKKVLFSRLAQRKKKPFMPPSHLMVSPAACLLQAPTQSQRTPENFLSVIDHPEPHHQTSASEQSSPNKEHLPAASPLAPPQPTEGFLPQPWDKSAHVSQFSLSSCCVTLGKFLHLSMRPFPFR